MSGKQTCEILKKIRRDIAEKNDIDLKIHECSHGNDVKCPGTCPACEAETRALEKALAAKKIGGKKIIIAGISAGLIAGNIGCSPIFPQIREIDGDMRIESTELEGDIAQTTDSETDETVELQGEMPYESDADAAESTADQTPENKAE